MNRPGGPGDVMANKRTQRRPPDPVAGTGLRRCRVSAVVPGGGGREGLQAKHTRAEARLQTTVDRQARSNQALRTSNETLSMLNQDLSCENEEFQRTQAELRALNEQLSDANAELAAKNTELQAFAAEVRKKGEELEQLSGDLESLALPALFLDRELCIRRFTAATSEALDLGERDIDCSIRDIAARFRCGDLALRAGEVLDTLQPRETELVARGRQFLVRLRPHRTLKNVIDGVVVTFVDISDIKRADTLATLSRLYGVLSRVNEAIVRTRAEQPLFEEVCRIVVEEGAFPLVWVGLVQEREVLPAAWCGPAAEYLRQTKVEVEGDLGRGPTGTAIREDRTVVNQDFRANLAMAPWRERAAALGFRSSAALPLHRQGKVIGALTLYAKEPGVFDTAHVQLLEALSADLSYALDAMHEERRRAEVECELRESESRLRDAERHTDEFLALLSHELRNPLAPIANSLFVLGHAPPGGEQASRARAVMARQVGQLARLVDDLLDVTRISRGKLRFVRKPFELGQLVRRAAEDHRPMFGECGIEFDLRMQDESLWVDGDEARIGQAVDNLLTNAAKFTPSGGRVVLELGPGLSDGMAVLRVRDTGAGMSPEMLGRIFEPFVQADDTLDRSRGGLGLGLAVVKRVVERHGGRVEGRSAGLGAGTEFVVWLPAEARAAEDRLPRPSSRPPPRRVLVIEDNQDSAETLRDVLELGQHQVQVARTGPDGLKAAQQLKPDLVLCDIGLPGMSGYEVASALRADESLRSARLVALTGYARSEDAERAAQAGFDRHLPKPPSIEQIEELLADLPPREGG